MKQLVACGFSLLGIVYACSGTPYAESVFRAYWSKIATNPPPSVSFDIDASVSKSGNDAYSVCERNDTLLFTGSNVRSVLYAGYGGRELLHTIGLGERLCYKDRAMNLKIKTDVMALPSFQLPRTGRPGVPLGQHGRACPRL